MWNGGFVKLYLSCAIVFLNSAINGYDLSLMTAIITMKPFIRVFGEFSIEKDPTFLAFFIGLLQIGSVSGTFFVGPAANFFGRVKAMALGSAIIIAGALLEVYPRTILMLSIGRFMVGFGVSFVTTCAPTYVVEIAHPVFRGRAGALYNTGWHVGALPAAFITYALANVDSDLAWELPLLLQAVFSGIVFLGCFFIPESPRYLMSKGRYAEARKFFVTYHADGDATDPIIDQQIEDFEESNKEKEGAISTFAGLFSSSALRYQMLVLLCVAFFTQYAGNFATGYFLPLITPYLGVDKDDTAGSLRFNAINSAISALAAFGGASLADKTNRRTLWIVGAAACALSMTGSVVCMGIYDSAKQQIWGIIAFVFLEVFAIMYSFCYTPLQSLYCVEVLSYNARATGMAFEQLLVNALSYVQFYIFTAGANKFGYKLFVIFIAIDAVAVFVYYKLYPETKGRTLEQIEGFFTDPRGVVKSSVDFETDDVELKRRKK